MMKIIRKTMMWLVFAIVCTSCSNLFYDTTPDVLQRIQKGMSKQGITQILGSPQYRRFDQNIEEWEYTKVLPGSSGRTSIIVSFEGDKVVAMDSFAAPQLSVYVPNEVSVSSPTIFVRGMRSADFQRFYNDVKARGFKDTQLEMMEELAVDNSLSCHQCARLMSLYTFDDDKMKVLRIFAPHIADKENYEEILQELTSLFKRNDAKALLKVR